MKKMNKIIFVLIFSQIFLFGCKKSPTETDNKGNNEEWELVWSDEFNYNGLPDSSKWSYDVGGHGWGNQELQFYTERRLENARVMDSFLVIEAHKELWEGRNYTSTRLLSRGKGKWTYGRMEIRAILPSGVGTWPAIWMLPEVWNYGSGGWPDNGEIDIMEHVGYDPGWVHASTHSKAYYWVINTQKTAKIYLSDVQTVYHNYILEWSEDTISIFIDSKKYFTFVNEKTGWETWPFDKDFFLILNIAVGGGWGGQQGVDDSIFPARMFVDYVRVYQKK